MSVPLHAVPAPASPVEDMWAGFETTSSAADPPPIKHSSEILPPPTNPMAVARHLMPAWTQQGSPALRHWRGSWMRWTGPHWSEVDDAAMRAEVYPRLEHCQYKGVDKRTGDEREIDWAPNRGKVANLLEAVAAVTHLPAATEVPAWLDGGTSADRMIPCQNGLLDIGTLELRPLTPLYFNRTSVPFDYNADAPVPVRWLDFLDSVWPGDPEAIDTLQEFCGYVLSGRTDLQKMMLVIGPPRSGKGTIARIMTALIGKANVAGPTLASMATNFGLQPLIDKSLAIISDARLPRTGAEIVVERLLSISGEDNLDIDRKYRDPWTGRVPARLMILSNELPAFADASGAIASRLVILKMTESFLGREDTSLEGDLMKELPGVLNWALEGARRLAERGRFVVPESSAEAVSMLADMVSPIGGFVRDCCTLGVDERVPISMLYDMWRSWCDLSGRDHPGTKETFGRNLLAAVPGLKRSRPYIGGVKVPCYVGLRLGADDSED